MKDLNLLELLLPEELLSNFEITSIEKPLDSYIIFLDEKNIKPKSSESVNLVSKGFKDSITITDFPLRGKPCYLKIRKRKWVNSIDGSVVSNNWKIASKGTRYTKDFASFLKGALR